MSGDPITLVTYDWVPQMPRGYVRDLRVRWLMEELDRPYRVETVPLRDKSPGHFAQQPFGQVPFIRDGDLTLFESGAILLYLAEGTDLIPRGQDRARVLQWVIAALNSIEPFWIAWFVAKHMHRDDAAASRNQDMLALRLDQLQTALDGRDWLVGRSFTVADLLMADILRAPTAEGMMDTLPALIAYRDRATDRPAFARAMADHMAHWQATDP